MSEPIITLERLIQHFESICKSKFSSLDTARELAAGEFPNRPLTEWRYLGCLRATALSNGSLSDATRLFRLHRTTQSQAHNRRLQRMAKQEDVRLKG
ncbi:Uncharacterised protein [Vibrio fluvialis]|uniref:Uncharacterized protein n=1 Tax=Vibrio fluvialis TaxID=676 RepID=A0AAX2LXG5_VIBFL|nr:Uncharacterised protein [Vibrio fluvialis]